MSTLIEIKNLTKNFPIKKGFWSTTEGFIKAVSNINLTIEKGQIIGLVGESGSGKSTLAKLILKLIEPSLGQVIYNGEDILSMENKRLRSLRQKLQIVFQNPYSSLNPRMKIKDIIAEPIALHNKAPMNNSENSSQRVSELLRLVGLEEFYEDKFPHELSGGQRQRVAIARALSLNPEFLILDEPVSALDVSVQAQILNLLADLQKRLDLTYLFISHNLSVVGFISTHIAVMYLGHIVEYGKKEDIIKTPRHPYTTALISASPRIETREQELETRKQRIVLSGEIPDPSNPPSGCVFRTRCPIASDICSTEIPLLDSGIHRTACHFPGKLSV